MRRLFSTESTCHILAYEKSWLTQAPCPPEMVSDASQGGAWQGLSCRVMDRYIGAEAAAASLLKLDRCRRSAAQGDEDRAQRHCAREAPGDDEEATLCISHHHVDKGSGGAAARVGLLQCGKYSSMCRGGPPPAQVNPSEADDDGGATKEHSGREEV